MANDNDLIRRGDLKQELLRLSFFPSLVRSALERIPAVEPYATDEKYEELREAFVDYVCSGVPNPAPYCKNRSPDCVDGRGWCLYGDNCRGFNPAERKE